MTGVQCGAETSTEQSTPETHNTHTHTHTVSYSPSNHKPIVYRRSDIYCPNIFTVLVHVFHCTGLVYLVFYCSSTCIEIPVLVYTCTYNVCQDR